jgi:hypothetical protein
MKNKFWIAVIIIANVMNVMLGIQFLSSRYDPQKEDASKAIDSCFYKAKNNLSNPDIAVLHRDDSYVILTTNKNVMIAVASITGKNALGNSKTVSISCTTQKINGNIETGRMVILDDAK